MNVNCRYEAFLKSFDSKKFQKLRPGQKYVLDKYSNEFSDYKTKKDVAIELPTGAGKSLISLLIAESWRKEGKKVAILTANKTLARQMKSEASELGIPSVLMEGRGIDIPPKLKREYHRSLKIGIMNYWIYFNQNPVIDSADLIIMDDAHLAEHCLHSLYSVEINNIDQNQLFNNIVTELVEKFPEYTVLHDALDENAIRSSPPELLSFIDQVGIEPILKEIIDSHCSLQSDTDLKFRWQRIRNSLKEANIYLGADSIWIRPYIYPINTNQHFQSAEQRLYMSATIGDPGDLCRRLGIKKINKIPVPQNLAENTNGRRLLVMNRIDDSDLPERLQVAILESLKVHPKSVWLCSSKREAQNYRDVVSEWLEINGFTKHPTWMLTNLGDEIERFKNSEKGHLFVAGRFDGMDFNADECRLVILATLPRAINIQEEFFCAYLRDSGFMFKRLNQRIIQALGRCNRDEGDFGVYVLGDRRFATHFGRESNRKGIPKNIMAEIDLAEDSTESTNEDLMDSINKFMNENFEEYDKDLEDALELVPEKQNNDSDIETQNEVIGWSALFFSKNYGIAAEKFSECYEDAKEKNHIEIAAFYGWCYAKALYLEGLSGNIASKNKALEVFEQSIIRGGQSSWFNRMRISLNRANKSASAKEVTPLENCATVIIQRFDEHLESLGVKGKKFKNWSDKIHSDLESNSHNEFQRGLLELGDLLGYCRTAPKHNASTDCRWRGVFGNSKEVITFEIKIEHEESNEISPYAIGQAHNQIHRALREFEEYGYTVRGTITTHLTKIHDSADSSAGNIKIITRSAILNLWNRVFVILKKYRDLWSLDNIEARKNAAIMITPLLPKDGWLLRSLDKEDRWISDEILLSEWPHSN
ncbi:Rad3-related DNA helicase [Tindallia magadiensis]|uniref:Rad3-related DNA helicase n=1 Tax=Tindallia magadiensis TaxID=69895 RepID=A0A1I3I406_9FIRM|nr:DEAD/DEAH box helicase family protein [Tindallia magadiensis]SFI42590.1 Rad3-related DNA helicase [Tindallia magadiensis]